MASLNTTATNNSSTSNPQSTRALLNCYYENIFPIKELYELFHSSVFDLSCFGKFYKREISFEYESKGYRRYNCYGSAELWKQALIAYKDIPIRIDIGSIYECSYSDPSINHFKSLKQGMNQRELVFDIDLTDYDDIRKCCQGKQCCYKCWKFAAAAYYYVNFCLQTYFKFSQILWVFSGGRGIHCWVFDHYARVMNQSQRAQLLNSFDYTNNQTLAQFITSPCHPRFYQITQCALNFFDLLLNNSAILVSPADWNVILNALPFEFNAIKLDMSAFLERYPKPRGNIINQDRWARFENSMTQLTNINWLKFHAFDAQMMIDKIKIWFVAPRFDRRVTSSLNHLLKCPYAVHPTTHQICIPFFDARQIDHFNPTCVTYSLSNTVENWNKSHCTIDGLLQLQSFCKEVKKSNQEIQNKVNLSRGLQ